MCQLNFLGSTKNKHNAKKPNVGGILSGDLTESKNIPACRKNQFPHEAGYVSWKVMPHMLKI